LRATAARPRPSPDGQDGSDIWTDAALARLATILPIANALDGAPRSIQRERRLSDTAASPRSTGA
jgi:hypothetical protein